SHASKRLVQGRLGIAVALQGKSQVCFVERELPDGVLLRPLFRRYCSRRFLPPAGMKGKPPPQLMPQGSSNRRPGIHKSKVIVVICGLDVAGAFRDMILFL